MPQGVGELKVSINMSIGIVFVGNSHHTFFFDEPISMDDREEIECILQQVYAQEKGWA